MGLISILALLLLGQDLRVEADAAKAALTQGRHAEAVRLYTDLVRALPDDPGMRLNLGLALHAAGRSREALAQFTAALQLKPDLVAARFMSGMAHVKLGETAAAIPALSDAAGAQPANPVFRLELADALLSLGRFREATGHFRKLTEVTPQDPKGWHGLSASYLGLARQTFDRMEKMAPDSAYVLIAIADSRANEHQYRSALALYRRALEQTAFVRGVHSAIASIYRSTGHADWAALEEGSERALPSPDCAESLAECAFQAGQYDKVLALTDNAETLFWKDRSYRELAAAALAQLGRLPPSADAHELMAEAAELQRDYRGAASELEEALRLAPGDRRLEALLARALWHGREFDRAAPLLEKLVHDDPNSAELNFELGDLHVQQDEPEKAIPLLKRAVSVRPKMLQAHASLARAYARAGQPAAAIPHYKLALPLDTDGSLHFQLARAYESTGDSAEAASAMRRFEEIRSKRAVDDDNGISPPPGIR